MPSISQRSEGALAAGKVGSSGGRQGVLNRYREHLPLSAATPFVSIGEGDTPLVRSRAIGEGVGCESLYFKLESCNPTGSFKDRGMVVAVAKALEEGLQAVLCASTGNTSASAAAFAAHCGLRAYVVVPHGRIAQGKLAQAVAHGAHIIAIDGNFDHALKLARQITEKHRIGLVNSVNPYRIEGQKTAAFEIVDALEGTPDFLFIPVGNAGNITAYWKGFVEYERAGRARGRPRMMGFQAAGAAPIVEDRPIENPQTVATAIRIGNPASWKSAVAARDESGGTIAAVTDEEIIQAYYRLAREEGIFAEPASAASVAGLLKMTGKGLDLKDKKVVCVITGTGLKDPETAAAAPADIHRLPADLAAIEQAMGWA
jgi:threonine synthase